MHLTRMEKTIIAQALADYQEGIERAVSSGDYMETDVEELDNVISTIEKKLELP